MDLGLPGKSAIVTGASRGIGLAITRTLLAEGASVVAVSKSGSAELKALEDGGRVRAVTADLTDPHEPPGVVTAALDLFAQRRPARSAGDRLHRRESRAHQLIHVAVERGRTGRGFASRVLLLSETS